MRRSTALLVAGLLVVSALAVGAEPLRAGKNLERRRAEVERAEQDLVDLVTKAKQDPRMVLVDLYLSWTRAEDFANPRREIRVAKLAEWLADEDAPLELRTRVKDALRSVTQRSLDPDLSMDEQRSRRSAFSRDKLVPLLVKTGDKSLVTRKYAAEILDSYWHFPDPDIQRYDPKDDATWRKAAEAYRNRLRGR